MKRVPRVQAKNKRKTRYEAIPKGRQTGREHGDGGDSKSRGKVQPEGKDICNHGRRCAEHTLEDIEKIINNAVILDTVTVSEQSRRMGKSSVFVHQLYSPIIVNGKKSIAKLYIAEDIQGNHKFYLTKMRK